MSNKVAAPSDICIVTSKDLVVSNATDYINPNITIILIGAAKPTSRQTSLISRLSKENHAHIPSSA